MNWLTLYYLIELKINVQTYFKFFELHKSQRMGVICIPAILHLLQAADVESADSAVPAASCNSVCQPG